MSRGKLSHLYPTMPSGGNMSKLRIQAITDQHAKADDGTILRTKALVYPIQVDPSVIVPPFATNVKNGAYAIWIETQGKQDGSDVVINPAQIIKDRLAKANASGKQLVLDCEVTAVNQSEAVMGDVAKGNGDKVYQTITFNVNRNAKRQLLEVEPAGWVL